MKLIAYDSLTATPWKNGGGITRELACYPVGASMSDFIWRVSIADVSASGPFSSFPGIDRVITLLDGDGMQLHFEHGAQRPLVDKLAPYAFRGEDKVDAQLIGSPSRDFNLMTRRNVAHGKVEVRRTAGVIDLRLSSSLLFCAHGEWQTSVAEQPLQQGDTLMIDARDGDAIITPKNADSALLCVRITMVSGH
ncbi:MAG TPA: HutD family protein [Burkholderiaceae bacterium]|jgi:environmental stress-induced protein Ves|nr:HutD family protein [Burkholderiaceae bacterium]